MQNFRRNTRYEILSPTGWENFDGVIKNVGPRLGKVITTRTRSVTATLDHRFFSQGTEIKVRDLKIGDVLDTNSGVEEITALADTSIDTVYDVFNSDSHVILANGIYSHQCDEFAFLRTATLASEFWTSVQPTLSCLAGDTLVLTNNGFLPIEDLHKNREVGEYFPMAGLQTFGKNGMEPVSHGYVSPHSDTLIIETQRGMRVECTRHHPLYALRGISAAMTRADQLAIGNSLRVQYGMNVYGNDDLLERTSVKKLVPRLAYMVGGMIAEGWITKGMMKHGVMRNMLSVSNIDDEFRNVFLESDFVVPFRVIKSNRSGLSVNSKELVALYEEIGFKPEWKCDTKEVPTKIFRAPKEVQTAFLRGLFDGDGCASGDVINLTSTSRKLLQQVQQMMLNLGIVSTLRLHCSAEAALAKKHILPQGKMQQTARDAFALTVAGGQRQAFSDIIGFGLTRKQNTLERLTNQRMGESKVFCVPKTPELVSLLTCVIVESGKTKAWFRQNGVRLEKALVARTDKGVITQAFIQKLLGLIDTHALPVSQEHLDALHELVGEFVWDPIVRITPSTNRTYDFTVPGTHSFLQNGILGSNTGGSCIITSTPKSDEDQFAQIWKGAIDNTDEFGNPTESGRGKNGFYAMKVPWWEHPERDEEWAKPFRETLGIAKFRQEFECDFVSDDETLINPLTLIRLAAKKPEFYTNKVRWFHEPMPNKAYVVGLDPSLGTGGDYAAIQVFQLPEMIQVAEWQHNRTDTRGQVRVLLQVLHFLDATLRDNPDQFVEPEIYWTVENNSIGEALLIIIEDTGEERFPGLFVSEKKRKGQSRRFRKGMLTDNRKKLSACARFKSLVESDRACLNSQQLIKQLKSFVATETSFKAKPGEHDDLVMATMLCVRMLDVVNTWGTDMGDLKEYIGDSELFEEAMPVVI